MGKSKSKGHGFGFLGKRHWVCSSFRLPIFRIRITYGINIGGKRVSPLEIYYNFIMSK